MCRGKGYLQFNLAYKSHTSPFCLPPYMYVYVHCTYILYMYVYVHCTYILYMHVYVHFTYILYIYIYCMYIIHTYCIYTYMYNVHTYCICTQAYSDCTHLYLCTYVHTYTANWTLTVRMYVHVLTGSYVHTDDKHPMR